MIAEIDSADAQPSISATQFIVEDFSSFFGASGKPRRGSKGRSKGKKKKASPTPELSPATDLPQFPDDSAGTILDGWDHESPDPNLQVSTRSAGNVYICRWDGCGHVLRIKKKRDYSRHLANDHGFHGAGSTEVMTCPWVDGQGRCEKELQMQSMIKHVCETHLHCLGMRCWLCGSHQARVDNMARHLCTCKRFEKLPEDEQRLKWMWWVKGKSFQYYLDNCASKRTRRSRGQTAVGE